MITFLVALFDALISFFLILILVLATVVLPYMMIAFLPLPVTIAIVIAGLVALRYL
jgi:hypothetical protein